MNSTIGFVLVCTLMICVPLISAGYYISDYYISHPLTANWWEASRFCTFYDYQLIDVPDEREYRKILDVLRQVRQNDSSIASHSIWTSGIRFPEDKTYYWENTGMPVIYADWASGDPNLGQNEQCLFMFLGDNWKLADSCCTEKWPFICRVRQSLRVSGNGY